MKKLWLLLLLTACGEHSITTSQRQPDAYIWKLHSSAVGVQSTNNTFVLDSIDDYLVGMYCYYCVPPLFTTQWCNSIGTGPGFQIKNTETYTGNRNGWFYAPAGAPRQPGYITEVCADSIFNDIGTFHSYDSSYSAIKVRVTFKSGEYRILTITGNTYPFWSSSLGYIHASGCAADSTLLWTIADTNGVLYGPFHHNSILADDGAWRFVKEGFTPQCLPN